ncbi:MAG: DUF4249 family protein [Sediminibacterium sp.]
MKKIVAVLMVVMAVYGCREKYVSPFASTGTGLLVVEGFIATGSGGITTIRLTRTTKLADSANLYEKKAQVTIQTQGSTVVYALTEGANGVYTSAALSLPVTNKYRIRILTAANKEYLSDYVGGKLTPAIDSIGFERNGGGDVVITSHSKGAQTTPYYFQWRSEQTWEIISEYSTAFKFKFDNTNTAIGVEYWDPITFQLDNTIKRCWQFLNSSAVLIGSTEGRSTNDVHEPMATITTNGIELSVLYSINVKQYSLSKDAYRFLEKIKKNTEQLGSIFDAQPSDLAGNIHATSDPAEVVVGYLDATQEQSKRIFIRNSQLPGWNYKRKCPDEVTLPTSNRDTFKGYATDYYPIGLSSTSAILAGRKCVVCTVSGSNVKPSYWP